MAMAGSQASAFFNHIMSDARMGFIYFKFTFSELSV